MRNSARLSVGTAGLTRSETACRKSAGRCVAEAGTTVANVLSTASTASRDGAATVTQSNSRPPGNGVENAIATLSCDTADDETDEIPAEIPAPLPPLPLASLLSSGVAASSCAQDRAAP